MILLRIVSRSESKIEQIAELLLRNRLAMDINIKRHIDRAELVNGILSTGRIYLITAKTRALLFKQVDKLLNAEFPDNLPEVYALPIVEMDWEQAKSLKSDLNE